MTMTKWRGSTFKIDRPGKLRRFRNDWSGKRILKLLKEHKGRLAINWEIGVGKSHNIDDVIEAAVNGDFYDLVVCLEPTRLLIDERRWIKNPPPGIKIVNLKPRPKEKCGPQLDQEWSKFEQKGLGLLGREEICGLCKRKKCFWPQQYGKALKHTRAVFATQAHLERSPFFIEQLKKWTEAETVLLLLDEAGFICKPLRRKISFQDIEQFHNALRIYAQKAKKSKKIKRWLYLLKVLLKAITRDLQSAQWTFFPLSPGQSIKLQKIGHKLYGDGFNFIAYHLVQFGKSIVDSRERHKTGGISYAIQPFVDCNVIIYSGTAEHEFLKFRIGKDFANPFEKYQFVHRGTVWYNIASRLGTRSFFTRNALQILDFYAQLIGERISQGKRPLLIAKKLFIQICVDELNRRLKDFGYGHIKVVIAEKDTDLSSKKVVPIINYGMIGINKFQDFDCAFCLTGYYVNERVANSILQDIVASDRHIPIKINTGGIPRRRTAKIINHKDRFYDVAKLAQMALSQQEMDVVLQAVGRVRPYTKPREIITFQCSSHPRMDYSREFDNIGEARSYFSIPSRKAHKTATTKEKIEKARGEGFNQAQIAKKLGLNIRTVKRYWS
ncbi:hypothetical protein [Desulfosarcina widdelii]|uniref:hypothetical protein n=1 Tax=Desulfosarcina widdelii TaxID=947919 RepID=UPI0012D32289|nr:hypothetical protein [Desulfosarcina widdelii]